MGIFSFLAKKKEFFSLEEKELIVSAIRNCETATSGEVRVFVESRNPYVDPVDRAAEVFYNLKMEETEHRNAVLLYIAMKDKELALFGDEGIYEKAGQGYWNAAVRNMLAEFDRANVASGIVQCVLSVGNTLKEKFPYDAAEDKNELPDEIVFGK